MMVPFESALRRSLEGSRGGRAHIPPTCRGDDHTNRVTPLSGTQLLLQLPALTERNSSRAWSRAHADVRLIAPLSEPRLSPGFS